MSRATTTNARLRIGELLVQAGLITGSQLEEALREQKRTGAKIVATLVSLGHIEQHEFLNFLARQPGVASIDLAGYCIPSELVALIPGDFARQHEIVPMDRLGSDLTVGMACPLDTRVIDELAGMTGLRVRALLVAPESIRLVLDRYYPDEEESTTKGAPEPEAVLEQATTGITFEAVMALVRSISALPALPDSVQQVQQAVADPNVGTREVAGILKNDPALTAKVISLANAPAHGFKQHVDSIETATALLGLKEVYSVTLAAAVVDNFSASSHFDYPGFWRRCVCCGNLAKILARVGRVKDSGGLFAAGLLHDIGRAVFAEVASSYYGTLDHHAEDRVLIAAEHEAFGIAHPEVGYVVARSWGLPAALCESIRFHHSPDRAAQPDGPVALVALAAELTDHLERPEEPPMEVCEDRCGDGLRALGIDTEQLTSILDIARALRNASPGD